MRLPLLLAFLKGGNSNDRVKTKARSSQDQRFGNDRVDESNCVDNGDGTYSCSSSSSSDANAFKVKWDRNTSIEGGSSGSRPLEE